MLKINKLHCSGNDILIVDSSQKLDVSCYKFLSHRNLAVGCDQIIHVTLVCTQQSLVDVLIINQDGSSAQQCLNGSLCLGLFLKKRYENQKWLMRINGGGENELLIGNKISVKLKINSLEKIIRGLSVWRSEYLNYHWGECDVGNPHAIIITQSNPYQWSLQVFESKCKDFLKDNLFKDGINVSFAQAQLDGSLRLRTYERGTGSTLACGSAALACSIVIDRYFSFSEYTIHTTFDSYQIELLEGSAVITGTPYDVFETIISDDTLKQGLLLTAQFESQA